jgi:putative aldouronate transport system substrate-binding protein
MVKYLDFWFTPEGTMMSIYGIEGESYYIDEDGIPQLTDNILHPTQEGVTSSIARLSYISESWATMTDWTRDQKAGMSEYALEAPQKWDYNWNDTISYPDVTRSAEEGEEYSHIMSDVETRINETIVWFVTGDKPMSEFDAFLAELDGMGLGRARDIQQTAYDRFIAR